MVDQKVAAMILTQLKESTSAAHHATEQVVERYQYLASLDNYRRLLERFWGFYLPLERQIATRPEWVQYGFDLEQRLKMPALTRDLSALGHTTTTLAALPLCDPRLPIDTFPATLGCMYVFEGATLGGQLIVRQVRAQLLPAQPNGWDFFASYGEQVGAMWRAFRTLMLAVAVDPATEAAMLDGAHATFRAFREWLVSGVAQ
jgi:heme oxygenase